MFFNVTTCYNNKLLYEETIKKVRENVDYSNMGKLIVEKDAYIYYDFITGSRKTLKKIDVDNLDERGFCKNGHKHMIESIYQSKNLDSEDAVVMNTYYCLDCIFNTASSLTVKDLKEKNNIKNIIKNDNFLKNFWEKINFI